MKSVNMRGSPLKLIFFLIICSTLKMYLLKLCKYLKFTNFQKSACSVEISVFLIISSILHWRNIDLKVFTEIYIEK